MLNFSAVVGFVQNKEAALLLANHLVDKHSAIVNLEGINGYLNDYFGVNSDAYITCGICRLDREYGAVINDITTFVADNKQFYADAKVGAAGIGLSDVITDIKNNLAGWKDNSHVLFLSMISSAGAPGAVSVAAYLKPNEETHTDMDQQKQAAYTWLFGTQDFGLVQNTIATLMQFYPLSREQQNGITQYLSRSQSYGADKIAMLYVPRQSNMVEVNEVFLKFTSQIDGKLSGGICAASCYFTTGPDRPDYFALVCVHSDDTVEFYDSVGGLKTTGTPLKFGKIDTSRRSDLIDPAAPIFSAGRDGMLRNWNDRSYPYGGGYGIGPDGGRGRWDSPVSRGIIGGGAPGGVMSTDYRFGYVPGMSVFHSGFNASNHFIDVGALLTGDVDTVTIKREPIDVAGFGPCVSLLAFSTRTVEELKANGIAHDYCELDIVATQTPDGNAHVRVTPLDIDVSKIDQSFYNVIMVDLDAILDIAIQDGNIHYPPHQTTVEIIIHRDTRGNFAFNICDKLRRVMLNYNVPMGGNVVRILAERE